MLRQEKVQVYRLAVCGAGTWHFEIEVHFWLLSIIKTFINLNKTDFWKKVSAREILSAKNWLKNGVKKIPQNPANHKKNGDKKNQLKKVSWFKIN